MNTKSILAALCSMMLVYAPLAEPASSSAIATLSSNGNARINGALVSPGSTVFAGDRLVNPENANTVLSMTGGSRILIVGSGSMRVEESTGQPVARLENGEIAVLSHANAPVVVGAAGTRITSGAPEAAYAVTVSGNNLQVMSTKGEVDVEGAGRTIEVSEGKTLYATMTPPSASSDSQQGPPAAASGGWAATFFTFDHVILIATAAAAAAALGIAIKSLLRTCKATGSPSRVTCD
jgi:hypothetical protein